MKATHYVWCFVISCVGRLHNGYSGGGGLDSPPPAPGVKKPPYVKKPLNAFMLFMKEMRPKVIEECTLKESAAINQILGRKVSDTAGYRRAARVTQIGV